jgi:transcription antitermination factor NusG
MPGTTRTLAKRWLVLYVRPRFERVVERHLMAGTIEHFLPLHTVLRQWSDRKKKVVVPLFPGYIFVHVDERERIAALEPEGSLKYVSFGGDLSVVPEDVISALRIAVNSGRPLQAIPERLAPGTPVRVTAGSATGLTGELVEYRGSSKVMVYVESVRQAVLLEVDVRDVARVVGSKGE